MKKRIMIAGFFILSIFAMAFASAQYSDVSSASYEIIDTIKGVFTPIFSAFFGINDELIFERILFFVLVLALVNISLKRFPLFQNKSGPTWIVTIAVSLLATRYLGDIDLVNNILISYTVVGVALTSAITFIIYALFVESFEQGYIRKVLWVLYLAIFLAIWYDRKDEVGKWAWIYLSAGGLALIFLLADGTIRRAMMNMRMKELDIHNREDYAAKIRTQLDKLEEDKRNNRITDSHYAYMKRNLNNQLRDVLKN